jgi:ankyrin repeat protein
VQLLLEDYKANFTAKANDGVSALHQVAFGGQKAVVQLLLKDYKANIEEKDKNGITAIHWAAL